MTAVPKYKAWVVTMAPPTDVNTKSPFPNIPENQPIAVFPSRYTVKRMIDIINGLIQATNSYSDDKISYCQRSGFSYRAREIGPDPEIVGGINGEFHAFLVDDLRSEGTEDGKGELTFSFSYVEMLRKKACERSKGPQQ